MKNKLKKIVNYLTFNVGDNNFKTINYNQINLRTMDKRTKERIRLSDLFLQNLNKDVKDLTQQELEDILKVSYECVTDYIYGASSLKQRLFVYVLCSHQNKIKTELDIRNPTHKELIKYNTDLPF